MLLYQCIFYSSWREGKVVSLIRVKVYSMEIAGCIKKKKVDVPNKNFYLFLFLRPRLILYRNTIFTKYKLYYLLTVFILYMSKYRFILNIINCVIYYIYNSNVGGNKFEKKTPERTQFYIDYISKYFICNIYFIHIFCCAPYGYFKQRNKDTRS